MPGLANTMISPSTPYGEKPVNLTSGGFPSAAYSAVALPTVAIIRMEAASRSVPDFSVNGTVTHPSLASVTRSSDEVFSTELGMTISSPLRALTTVCRQVMSLTTPVVPATVTKSPG